MVHLSSLRNCNKSSSNVVKYQSINSFQCLSREISNEWKDIGRELGLDDSKLDNIETDYSGNQKEQVYQMFLMWYQESGQRATYRVLREALIAASRKDLVDKWC